MLSNWLWITMSYAEAVVVNNICYAEPVVVNHGVLFCAIGCESWWIILSRMFVNHGLLYWGDNYESRCAMLRRWLWIMMGYDEPSGCESYWVCRTSGCESWFIMLNRWLWIMVSNAEPVDIMFCYAGPEVVNHGELWWATGCVYWCVMLSQLLYTMVCYTELVVLNHAVSFWTSGCELWRFMPIQWLWIMVC
jgi:hypothetical protein